MSNVNLPPVLEASETFLKWLDNPKTKIPDCCSQVHLSGIRINRTINLSKWKLYKLVITDSDIRGSFEANELFGLDLKLDRTSIAGRVDLRGCKLSTLSMIDTRVLGSVHIGLHRQGETFKTSSVGTLNLNGLTTGGLVNLNGLQANTVSMILANVGGFLSFKLAPYSSFYSDSEKRTVIEGDLDLHGIKVNGFLTLRGVKIGGKLILTCSEIGGMFSCRPWRHDEREDPNVIDTILQESEASQVNSSNQPPSKVKQGLPKPIGLDDQKKAISSEISGGIFAARSTIKGLFDISGADIGGPVDISNGTVGGLLAEPRVYPTKSPLIKSQIDGLTGHLEGKGNWWEFVKVSEFCDASMWCCDAFRHQFSKDVTEETHRYKFKPLEDVPEKNLVAVPETYQIQTQSVYELLDTRIKRLGGNPLQHPQRNRNLIRRRCAFGLTTAQEGWPRFQIDKLVGSNVELLRQSLWPSETQKKASTTTERFSRDYLDRLAHLLFSPKDTPSQNDFSNSTSKFVHQCHIKGTLNLDGVRIIGSVEIRGTHLEQGISAQVANIEGHFIVRGWMTQYNRDSEDDLPNPYRLIPSAIRQTHGSVNSRSYSIQAEDIKVGGYVSLSGSIFEAGVNFAGATISGSFYADSVLGFRTIIGPSLVVEMKKGDRPVSHGEQPIAYSLCLANATIGATLKVDGSYMARGIVLENAEIGGDILAASPWIDDVVTTDSTERRTYIGQAKWLDKNVASVLASNLSCEGNVDFRGSFLVSGLIINEANFKGSVYLGSRIRQANPDRILESYMVSFFGQARDMSDCAFSLVAVGATIGGNLDCQGAFFQNGMRLSLSSIGGHLLLNASHTTTPNLLLRTFLGEGTGSAVESTRDGASHPNIDASGVAWNQSSRSSVLAMRASITGHMYCEGAIFTSGVDLSDSTIGGSVYFSPKRGKFNDIQATGEPIPDSKDGELIQTLVGMGERFRSHFMLRMPRSRVEGSVDLTGLYCRGWFPQGSDGKLKKPLYILDLNESIIRGDLSIVDDRERFSLFQHMLPSQQKTDSPRESKFANDIDPTKWHAKLVHARENGTVNLVDLRKVKCDRLAIYRSRVDLFDSFRKVSRETTERHKNPSPPKVKKRRTIGRFPRWAFCSYSTATISTILLLLIFLSSYQTAIVSYRVTICLFAFGISLMIGLANSYKMVRWKQWTDFKKNALRPIARTYQISGIECNSYHFADTSELKILEPENQITQKEKDLRRAKENDLKKLRNLLILLRPAGHGSEYPSFIPYAWASCWLFCFTLLIGIFSIFHTYGYLAKWSWTFIFTFSSLLCFLVMFVFPSIRRVFESDESRSREYGSIFRSWFLGRCEPREDVYRSIESMLINQGRLREADSVCAAWQSRNIWSDPFGSVFDMAAHLFIRHGLRVREILLLYGALFLFSFAIFSQPTNLIGPKTNSSTLSKGIEMTLFTLIPFSQPGLEQHSDTKPSLIAQTPLKNASHKPDLVRSLDSIEDGPAILSVSDDISEDVYIALTPQQIQLGIRIIAFALFPLLLPSLQRAIPRLRDRRAH